MLGNELILVINFPGPIEELSDFYFSLCIRSSIGAWSNIQDQSSDPNGIVIADGRAIAEADDSI